MLVWDSTSVLEFMLLLGRFEYEGDVGESCCFLLMWESRLLLLIKVEDMRLFRSKCWKEPCRLRCCVALSLTTAAGGTMGPLLSFSLLCWAKNCRPFLR